MFSRHFPRYRNSAGKVCDDRRGRGVQQQTHIGRKMAAAEPQLQRCYLNGINNVPSLSRIYYFFF